MSLSEDSQSQLGTLDSPVVSKKSLETESEEALGLDDEDERLEEEISLVSKEKKVFKVPKKAALLSNLIKTSLEGDPDATEVQLLYIEADILEKITKWMIYHIDKPPPKINKPLISSSLKECGVDSFDVRFVETDQATILRLMLAANYMDINDLLVLASAKLASWIRGKNPEQIRKTFNIRSDYTAEEEELIRKEHRNLLG
eukprot:gb/GEZN01018717.1/.p1 GENE.gb/GEZN01018717.1/~~gb/GEZN01018717.1/.p1  ORF type:complete len:201 (-),score=34.99 gb/GEZN01018717.1/:124-726(-)